MLSYLADISYMKTNALSLVDTAVPTRLTNSDSEMITCQFHTKCQILIKNRRSRWDL